LFKVANKPIVGLADLQGQSELNYRRLQQIFPDMRIRLQKCLAAGPDDSFRLELQVTERAPYTTHIWVSGQMKGLPWAGYLDLDVKVYEDARMAEVTHSNAHRLLNLRNAYPNVLMLQPEEKWHENQFLGVWLDYFLSQGREMGGGVS
jgi:uncharacterized protein